MSTVERTKIRLANGASILKIKEVEGIGMGRYVVLAFRGEDAVQPFVTWKASLDVLSVDVDCGEYEERLNCYWGHYYFDIEDALEDFKERE